MSRTCELQPVSPSGAATPASPLGAPPNYGAMEGHGGHKHDWSASWGHRADVRHHMRRSVSSSKTLVDGDQVHVFQSRLGQQDSVPGIPVLPIEAGSVHEMEAW